VRRARFGKHILFWGGKKLDPSTGTPLPGDTPHPRAHPPGGEGTPDPPPSGWVPAEPLPLRVLKRSLSSSPSPPSWHHLPFAATYGVACLPTRANYPNDRICALARDVGLTLRGAYLDLLLLNVAQALPKVPWVRDARFLRPLFRP